MMRLPWPPAVPADKSWYQAGGNWYQFSSELDVGGGNETGLSQAGWKEADKRSEEVLGIVQFNAVHPGTHIHTPTW